MSESKLKQAGAYATWTYNGHSYGFFKTTKTWGEASSFAKTLGGYLTKVDNVAENNSIYSKLSSNFTGGDQYISKADDGGAAGYVWLGASDSAIEGNWKWVKDSSALDKTRAEWGRGVAFDTFIKEPDNSYDQDFLAMGLTKWPNWDGDGQIGSPGQWNDVQGINSLYFVVEMDSTTSKDTTAPTITSVSPSDNSKNVAVTANFVLNFNESMKAGTGSFLVKSGDLTLGYIAVNDSSQVSFSGSTVTINPKANLTNNTSYSVSVAPGVLTDLAGNKWAGTGSNPYDFSTIAKDTTAPIMTSVTPADNSKNIAVDANFVLNFNESIKAGTGNFVVKSGNLTVAYIAANDNSQVSFSGSTMTINPKANLTNNTSYSVSVAPGVLTDLSGNKWAGTGSNPYDFTTIKSTISTDVTPPESPNFLDWTPSKSSNLRFQFNESIKVSDGSLLWLSEVDADANKIGSKLGFSYSINGALLTINPDSDMKVGHHYGVGFDSNAIADLVGNAWPDWTNIYTFSV